MIAKYIENIQHIGLNSLDIERTKKFYTGLGFKEKWETIEGDVAVAYLEYGSVMIETFEVNNGKPGAIDHIALNCSDIVACYKELKEAGHTFKEELSYAPYWEHGIGFLTIIGPNNENIEFSQIFASEEEKEKILKELV